MITFKEIKYFIAVSEELNFRKAAKKINISQPPLSQQIKLLETKIGFKLFDRNRGYVKLTKPGLRFLEDCYDISLKIDRSINVGKKFITLKFKFFFEIMILLTLTPFFIKYFSENTPLKLLVNNVKLIFFLCMTKERSIARCLELCITIHHFAPLFIKKKLNMVCPPILRY